MSNWLIYSSNMPFPYWFISLCLGKVIVHALDEKARAYYNLEGLWTPGTIQNEREEVSTRLAYIGLTCKFDLVMVYKFNI